MLRGLLLFLFPAPLPDAADDILGHRHIGEQRILLEQIPDPALLQG